MFINLTICKH